MLNKAKAKLYESSNSKKIKFKLGIVTIQDLDEIQYRNKFQI